MWLFKYDFRRQRTLCIETYKTLNKLNPGYMNNISKHRNTDRKIVTKPGNSKSQSSHFWNENPEELRSENMEYLTLPYKNFR